MIWPQKRLSDLGTWYGGSTPSKNEPAYWTDGTVPWLSPKDMGAEVLRGTRDHITDEAVRVGRARVVPANSVAVVVRSGILDRTVPIAFVPFETTLNQDMKAISTAPDVDGRWVAWALRSQERDILATDRKSGTTVASLDSAKLLSRTIPAPSLLEQRRIVDILEEHLSRIDAGQATLKSVLARSDSLVRSVAVRRLLGVETAAVGELFGRITADVDLPPLDRREWRRLGDLAEVVGGVTKDSNRTGDSMVEVPYLRVANVQRMRLDLRRISTILVTPAKAQALKLEPGDVLLNEGGDRDKLARGWVWNGEIEDCIHQNHVYRARPDQSVVEPEWLGWVANYLGAEWAARHGRQSVNLASISLTTIRHMPIPLADRGEQRRVLQELAEVREAAERLSNDLEALARRSDALRRGVLSAAFSGELTGHPSDSDRIEELADASHHAR